MRCWSRDDRRGGGVRGDKKGFIFSLFLFLCVFLFSFSNIYVYYICFDFMSIFLPTLINILFYFSLFSFCYNDMIMLYIPLFHVICIPQDLFNFASICQE